MTTKKVKHDVVEEVDACESCSGTGRGVPPSPSTVSACVTCKGSGISK